MKDVLEIFASRCRFDALAATGSVSLPSQTGSADAFLAMALSGAAGGEERVVVAVTPGLPDADRLADDLATLGAAAEASAAAKRARVFEFPPALDGDKSALGARLKTIAALKAWEMNPYPCIVVAAYPALAIPIPRQTPPPVRLGAVQMRHAELCEKLSSFGYRRVPAVESEGDWSVRGGIVDMWSPGEEFPVRAEFFGDDLESLRTFDASTQRSIERIASAQVLPAQETAADGDATQGGGGSPATLLAIIPRASTILAIDHNSYTLPETGGSQGEALTRVYTGDPAPAGVATCRFQTTPLPGFGELGAEEAHHPELFEAARARLARHIETAKRRGETVVELDGLSGGFELPPDENFEGLAVVTKADRVFTKKKTRAPKHVTAQGARLSDFEELEPGEYVVHVDHGVGRFIGSSVIQLGGKRSEVFTIEYADGAKLHVPAAHAHLLSRYIGVRGQEVRLHRLDGKRWSKDKADAQKAVADLAASLLETQARREVVPGFAYDVHCEGRDAFDAAFPFEETPDQLAAIKAVEADMASRRPMDRLICGDAGYGKTEVAMRAAYIAALNGKQTAVLAPTTVLAEQHFETFTSRFDGTPVRIESVSRFQSGETHKGTFKRLASGACDIVIGTHAILTGKAAFHDLGLIIIDEEQRFGVRHKEFLKKLRATADVLTLSATPIPRTLYLSMTGARDLSLLRSPPRERVAVETTITRDSDDTIGAAVDFELARGGQVFFLYNRVTTMGKMERRLKTVCPGARIVTAHGQMDSRTLARKMRDFERGDYDILLSTTIIESGIDIPRANTIIIADAHTFGLADLYQLRGRVGRSSRQGRAVFLLPAEGLVDSDARERLAALKRHGGLGAGFGLAVRDLELRGAGNLLGSQQSGHIAAVGFSLYCQLLKRTVALLKGEKVNDVIDVQLNLDFISASPAPGDEDSSAAIPFSYVEDDAQRMGLMRRLAEAADTGTVRAIEAEMADRFGTPPVQAKRLVRLAELRVACAKRRINHVDVRGTRAVFYVDGSREIAFVRDLGGANADAKLRELAKAVKKQTEARTISNKPSRCRR